MDKEDLGAVDEAEESPSDSDRPAEAGARPRESRPVLKVDRPESVRLSRTFQSEVDALPKAVEAAEGVELSQTFQSEVERFHTGPATSRPPPVPPPSLTLPRRTPAAPPGREVVRAERLAKRLKDRRTGETKAPSIPPPRPLPSTAPKKEVPSRHQTLDGMPLPAFAKAAGAQGTVPAPVERERPPAVSSTRRTLEGTPSAPPPVRSHGTLPHGTLPPPELEEEISTPPAEIVDRAATMEGPAPSVEELEEAARALGLDVPTLLPPPESEPATAPLVRSPPDPPLESTPAHTTASPPRPIPLTVSSEVRATDRGFPIPAFTSELLEASDANLQVIDPPAGDSEPPPVGTDPGGTVDLSATFRSEVAEFDPTAEEETTGSSDRRARTDTESADATASHDPFDDLAPGTEVGGRYRLERVIGRGATGIVFEASHLVIGKRVALKCLYPHYLETPNAVERFLREAKIAATVEHPNVVAVFDGGRSNHTMFLAMELLVGETLGDRLERGPLAVREGLDLFLKLVDGIAAVHERGVVHRDLKPDNIFLPTPKGDRPTEPKVLDFGVSKLKEPGRKELTSLGTVLGTPYYMSPEQIRATRDVDATADVYSLGVILYEMLAGDLPYEGDSVVDIFEAARKGEHVPLDRRVDGLPTGLSGIVARALSAQREQRFTNARELHVALEAVVHASTDPSREPPTDPRGALAPDRVDSSPLIASRADSVPERDIAAIARSSDAVLRDEERAEVRRTIELEAERLHAAKTTTATTSPATTSPATASQTRVWFWVGLLIALAVVSGVIALAAHVLLS
ncbi:MAG: protein kinase [Sandaracinaceae bacterium]